jgi:NAD(P)-dependent dehydrogenase (short-subunit alcohol dehydrogenase family)
VRSNEDREALVAAALDRYGRIDVLLNNGGIAYAGPAEDEPLRAVRTRPTGDD